MYNDLIIIPNYQLLFHCKRLYIPVIVMGVFNDFLGKNSIYCPIDLRLDQSNERRHTIYHIKAEFLKAVGWFSVCSFPSAMRMACHRLRMHLSP